MLLYEWYCAAHAMTKVLLLKSLLFPPLLFVWVIFLKLHLNCSFRMSALGLSFNFESNVLSTLIEKFNARGERNLFLIRFFIQVFLMV